MDALITVANLLNAAGYFLKDRLWVRALSFTAASCLAGYYMARPGPVATMAYWSVFFAVLNALFIGRMVLERWYAADGRAQCEP